MIVYVFLIVCPAASGIGDLPLGLSEPRSVYRKNLQKYPEIGGIVHAWAMGCATDLTGIPRLQWDGADYGVYALIFLM